MSVHGRIGLGVIAAGIFLVSQPGLTSADAPAATANPAPQTAKSQHDGQHDFDFLLGSWRIHLKRRLHPLTGSNEWVEFDGTVVCRKVWGDRAELEEFDVDNPDKHIVIHGMAIRIYNPKAHQWRIYWADADRAVIDFPPVVGEFSNGRGEFIDQEVYEGRAILVRYVWTGVTTSSPHFEQSYSDDGGKTWEANWITDQVKATSSR